LDLERRRIRMEQFLSTQTGQIIFYVVLFLVAILILWGIAKLFGGGNGE